jgi:TPR repeat protein
MRGLLIIMAAVFCLGCQANQIAPTTPEESVPDVAVDNARAAFLAKSDLDAQLYRLMELELQALQLSADEPLKLGSIGSAILDIYYGSQTGHYVMGLFYDHVDSPEAKAPHDAWLAKLQSTMATERDGSRESPFEVMTIYDGHTYARTQGASPVGSIYQSTDEMTFGALLLAREGEKPVDYWFFDMTKLLEHVVPEDAADDPWPLVRELANKMDTAAQTAIGAFLTNSRTFDAAVGWLTVASRTGNMLANTLLARIYWTQADQSEDDEKRAELRELSQENHLHAVALGSTESMYTLAHLYLEGHFGENNTDAAIALLDQAGNLDHSSSLLYLAHLHSIGEVVDVDAERANGYYQRAAALGDPQAVITYGRYLVTSTQTPDTTGAILDWLEDIADEGLAEAMVVLGNLHARGIGTKQSSGRAVRWYKKAVKTAKSNADIVNEVAWTLTVSDVDGLKRARYAKRIMDSLMASDEQARARPEYLDTWAAAHAASGDFTQALDLQQQAIAAASNQEREDVMEILKEHLELFRAGTTITEKAP